VSIDRHSHSDNPMLEERMNLHDLLLRDWGTDLPIRGGWGGSREDPIIVTAPDAESVAATRVVTLRGIGNGRGVFWRTISLALLDDPWPGIEQFKIETVQLTDTQIITQTENHYFDVSAMIAAQKRWLSSPVIAHHDECGLAFPFEIGWLHFDSARNYEQGAPGLGYSLCYRGPGVTATVYVYDQRLADIPDDVADSVIRDEFERAAHEIATERPDLVAWPGHPNNPDCIERYYRAGDDGRGASHLWLTTACGRFLKARVSWDRDPFIDKAAKLFVDTLLVNTRSSDRSDNPGSRIH
jgi:hypothetical protein